MDDQDKVTRANAWKALNFGGIVDWAIDPNTVEFDGAANQKPWGVRKGQDSGLDPRTSGSSKGVASTLCSDDDDSWRGVNCNSPAVVDGELFGPDIWSISKASAAWCAGIRNWTAIRDNAAQRGSNPPNKFTNTINDYFFKGPPNFNCGVLAPDAITGCIDPAECRDAQRGSAASMMFIGTSLHVIQNVSGDRS